MEDIKQKIGQRIKNRLGTTKAKQNALAKHAGIAPSSLSQIIAGDKGTSVDRLAKIADFLNVTLDWLITGKEKAPTRHSDEEIELTVQERHAAGWECKGEGISETERRIIGMLRRLPPEMRQLHFDAITDSYFLAMEREMEGRTNKG